MAHRIAGLDLSLAGTAAVVLAGDGSIAAMLVYSSTERDHKNGQRPGLELHRATTVHRGDTVADFQRTCGIADVVQKFLRCQTMTSSLIGIEDHAYGAQGASIYQLGHLHGMVRRDVVRLGCKFVLLNVKEVKQAATGKGNAQKADMVVAAKTKMDLDGLSVKACEGLADAYAVARLTFWLDKLRNGYPQSSLPGDVAAILLPSKNRTGICDRVIVG